MESEDEGGGLFDFGLIEKQEEDRVGSRCELERKRAPVVWMAPAQPEVSNRHRSTLRGIFYEMDFPVSENALHEVGADWLTAAMHAAGTLTGGNSVLSLSKVQRLGNSLGGAIRLLLNVKYTEEHDSLHNLLIMKISSGVLVKRGKSEHRSAKHKSDKQSDFRVPFPFAEFHASDYFTEINFCRLFEDVCPYQMPRFYFGDICSNSGQAILIAEFIPLPGDIKLLHSVKFLDICFFQEPKGSLLSFSGVAGSKLETSRDELVSNWTLEYQDTDSFTFMLRSWNDTYLVSDKNSSRVACLRWDSIQATGIQQAQWTFELEGEGVHIRSANNTYLTVASASVFLSSNARGKHNMWQIIPVRPKILNSAYRHFDLKNFSYTACKSIMHHGAQLAGMYKTGELGSPELLNQSFSQCAANSYDWGSRASTSACFMKKAKEAEDFIGKVGASVLLPETTLQDVIKEYRLLLAIAHANYGPMTRYLSSEVDYIALGRGRTDVDNAFSTDQALWTGGFRDWEGMSVGPLGAKIWDWLRFADSAVFDAGIDDLLSEFIIFYRNSGGPLLDFSTLRIHFLVAGALDNLRLLDSIGEIYGVCPPEQWSSIESLNDKRILEAEASQGSLWQCVKSFANMAWLLKSVCVSEIMLITVIPSIVPLWRLEIEPAHFLLVKGQAEVRDGPEGISSALLTSLKPGTPVLCSSTYGLEDADEFVQITSPLAGWITSRHLEYMYFDGCNKSESDHRVSSDARWTCLNCSCDNYPDSDVCEGCATSRSKGSLEASTNDLSEEEVESQHSGSEDEGPSTGSNIPASRLSLSQGALFALLKQQTRGEFDISDMPKAFQTKQWGNSEEAISVISPTGSTRHHFHPFLYRCFCQQVYQPRELIVIDTGDMSSSPSKYFTDGAPARDPRVIYKHFKTKEDWTIGAKRNAACYFANGSVIVHFDDDDVYTQGYLSLIMNVLRSGSNKEGSKDKVDVSLYPEDKSGKGLCPDFAADAATAQSWYTFSVNLTSVTEPPRWGCYFPSLEDQRRCVLGYGFSFAYLKSAWSQSPFPNMNLGEDTEFFEGLLAKGARIALLNDRTGICAHVYHRRNCSGMEDSELMSQSNVSKHLVNATRRLQLELKMPTAITAPREISVEECLAGLQDLVKAFRTPECQAEFHKVLKEYGSEVVQYGTALRDIVLKHQAPFMPKYGFEATLAGLIECHRAWTHPAIYKLDDQRLIIIHQCILGWLRNPHWHQRDLSLSWKEFTGQTADHALKLRLVRMFESVGIFVPYKYRK